MPKFIAVIEDNAEVIEAKDRDEAEKIAYEMWQEQVDENWYVQDATKENLAYWGLEETDDED